MLVSQIPRRPTLRTLRSRSKRKEEIKAACTGDFGAGIGRQVEVESADFVLGFCREGEGEERGDVCRLAGFGDFALG